MSAADIRLEPLTETNLGAVRAIDRAAAFYLRHGFRPTDAMEGEDIYYLRYPGEE